jgi:ADP-ribosylglycohydrolase
MRAAPVGAFFADDPGALVENATLSAAVTHSHPEGVAGAVAVAAAAAFAWRLHASPEQTAGTDLLGFAHDLTPPSETRDGIAAAPLSKRSSRGHRSRHDDEEHDQALRKPHGARHYRTVWTRAGALLGRAWTYGLAPNRC